MVSGLQVATLPEHLIDQFLFGLPVGAVVADQEQLLNIVECRHDERAIVDLLQTHFVQDLLGLGRGISGLFDSHDAEKNVDRHALILRQGKSLHVGGILLQSDGSLVSLVMNKVSLLLHVATSKDLRHLNKSATSTLSLVLLLLLTSLNDFSLSTGVIALFFLSVILSTSLEQCFLLNATK